MLNNSFGYVQYGSIGQEQLSKTLTKKDCILEACIG